MSPTINITINDPTSTGINEIPKTVGPHGPKITVPIHSPIKPAIISPAQLPGILKGDNFSATAAIIKTIMAVSKNERTLI